MDKPKNGKGKQGIRYLTEGAMIAALYAVLTFALAPISFGNVQVRVSEMLTCLPCFTPAAIPGLFIGCILANILGGAVVWDVIFGSIATLIGAVFTYKLRSRKYLAPIPPIVSNTLIVPLVLRYAYGIDLPILLMMGTVGAGEVISCYVLGTILRTVLDRYRSVIFRSSAG